MRFEGGCLCKQVTFTVTGGHHVAATSARRDSVEISGKVTWFQSSDTAKRGFCGSCGSNLFWDGPGQNLSILTGTLDGATGLQLTGHIFCADKGDYYEIDDGLPCAPQDDPDMTTMVP